MSTKRLPKRQTDTRASVISRLGVTLLVCGGALLSRHSRAQEPPWTARNDLPLPSGARSVEIVRADEPLFSEPAVGAPRRGTAALGARLPIYGALRSAGCRGRWLLVGALAWVCEQYVRWSPADPIAAGVGPRATPDGLPFAYYFIGPDGALGYRNLAFAEEGVPDAEFEPGFAVGMVEVQSRAPGDVFGLTTHGLWLPLRDASRTVGSTFQGVELAPGQQVGWIVSDTARVYKTPAGRVLQGEILRRFEQITVTDSQHKGGQRWYRIAGDRWLSARDARVSTAFDPPSELAAFERWLDVDLENQVLTAYEGKTAVFATLIASGKGRPGTLEATPKGVHRIWVKLHSTDMDNLEDEEAGRYYAMQSVPWVLFFQKGYGLHGTYWHNGFGRPRSHGCVNLSPRDARRIFDWASPRLPAGWTAVFPSAYEPGTLIRIR
jgi:hypothetical protein